MIIKLSGKMPKQNKPKYDIKIVKGGNTGWASTHVDAAAYQRYHQNYPGSIGAKVFIAKSTPSSGNKLTKLNESIKNEIINHRSNSRSRK